MPVFDGLQFPRRQPPQLIPSGAIELDQRHELAQGLIGCWPLSEDSRDYSAWGNHATASGGAIGTVIGKFGPAANLPGATRYYDAGSFTTSNSGSGLTVSVWV